VNYKGRWYRAQRRFVEDTALEVKNYLCVDSVLYDRNFVPAFFDLLSKFCYDFPPFSHRDKFVRVHQVHPPCRFDRGGRVFGFGGVFPLGLFLPFERWCSVLGCALFEPDFDAFA